MDEEKNPHKNTGFWREERAGWWPPDDGPEQSSWRESGAIVKGLEEGVRETGCLWCVFLELMVGVGDVYNMISEWLLDPGNSQQLFILQSPAPRARRRLTAEQKSAHSVSSPLPWRCKKKKERKCPLDFKTLPHAHFCLQYNMLLCCEVTECLMFLLLKKKTSENHEEHHCLAVFHQRMGKKKDSLISY